VALFTVAVVIYAALALLADAPRLVAALAAFQWLTLPLAVVLTLGNYALRFAKWQYFLGLVGVSVPWRPSLTIFLVGLGMAITPGKVGEFVKSHLLRESFETPLSVSAPAVVADRVTDLLAMVILAFGGLASREGGPTLAVALLIGSFGAVQLLRWRAAAVWVLDLVTRLPGLNRRGGQLRTLYESAFRMLAPRPLATMTLLSTVAWLGECLALVVILVGLGQPLGWTLGLESTSAYALATLVGAVSLLPGGLGAQELSLTSLLWLTGTGISREQAASATILVRLVTFWLGILIGLTALGIWLRVAARRPGRGPAPIGRE
jgi:uncharacterized membrane protein YbhN (UPF0104 family)